MMSDNDSSDFIAAFAIFGVFVMPIVGWVVVKWLAHRERMEMIRHGVAPPPGRIRRGDWNRAMSAGTANRAGMPNPPGASSNRGGAFCGDDDLSYAAQQIVLRKGIRLTFIGMALTLGLSFIGYSDGSFGPHWHPGPWLLGGLIPTFIGLSQVVSAMLSGATVGPNFRGSGSFGPPPPYVEPPFNGAAPPPAAGMPTYDSSYTYRPGGTQELRPPTPPPERR